MKTVDEIMALVAALASEKMEEGKLIGAEEEDSFCWILRSRKKSDSLSENLRSAIEAALKEREAPPKAQPMSDEQIDLACSNSGCLGKSEESGFYHGVKAAERHQNITGE